MSNSISPILMERVDAGLEWANENIPDWRKYVDPATFDLLDGNECFLGQYYRATVDPPEFEAFEYAYREVFGRSWDRTAELGFTTSLSFTYSELTQAWLQKFREIGHVAPV